MGKNKDIQRSFVRYAGIATAAVVLFLLVKKDNVINWIQAGFTLQKQRRQIEYLQKENDELDRRIRTMTEDRDSLEKFARENYFFAEPGDDVFIIQE